MALGLRLSHVASVDLIKKNNLHVFRQWLIENDAYVFTMNGFPYGEFHHASVKDSVHLPDWSTKERVDYTLRLFDILVALLPPHLDGGVSTSPLSYRHWFPTAGQTNALKQTATANILMVAEQLISIHKTTGKLLHLDIEPEPDGIIESGREFIDWYNDYLLAEGTGKIAAKCAVSLEEAAELIKTHIRICYDVCHFSIGYEPHTSMIAQLAENGIRIGKIQVSAALKAFMPTDVNGRLMIREAFASFNEPTYLHQVIGRTDNEKLLRYPDLPQALHDVQNTTVSEWRAHFHVPVFKDEFGLLYSTQEDIIEVLQLHKGHALTEHLEVETYTWEVLAKKSKLPLQQSIIRELQWVLEQMQ